MRCTVLVVLLWCGLPAVSAAERARIDLDGAWDFRLDPRDQGEAGGWHSAGVPFPRTLTVPGAWQAQGIGEPKGPLRHDYSGVAWYRRSVDVPAGWRGKTMRLRIGGAHRYTTLFVNGRRIGQHRGFSAPFTFDVTDAIRPGEPNLFALKIENPGEVPRENPREQKPVHPTGMLNYLGNWGGIYGHVELQATAPTWIEHVYVRPDVERRLARFVLTVRHRGSEPFAGDARVSVAGVTSDARASVKAGPGGRVEVDLTLPMPDARLWSPEDPHLHTAVITLSTGRREEDRVEQRFGMRQLQTRGNVLLLNGRPLYLRGYGDDNIEVLTGFPPASRDVYLERLRQVRAFGFNAVRFHSMTPAEGFFEAADEVGLFVMAELPAAYTQYVLPHREFYRRELEDVVMAYRNRPSLLSIAFGNEFNLDWLATDADKQRFLETVNDFYQLARSLHPDGLFLSNDGYVMRPTDLVSHFGGGLPDVPVVKHEFGEYYCSLPDITLIDRFTGVVDPVWLHEKKRWVDAQGLSTEYDQYVRNSQRLQHLGRKYQIERVRRQRGVTGYHYWLIVDFPGGTGEGDSWAEGWFDYFWRPKGITPRDGQTINSAVLPMIGADVGSRVVWSDTPRTVDVHVSNYGSSDLARAPLKWRLTAGGETLAAGDARIDVAMGHVDRVAQVTLGPIGGREPRKLELEVEVDGAHANTWPFWSVPRADLSSGADVPVYSTVRWDTIRRLFPFVQQGLPPAGSDALLLTPSLDEAALDHLQRGGRVWVMAEGGRTRSRAEVAFFPAAGGALGTVVRDHLALGGVPHDGFGDLLFFNLMDGAVPVPLDSWPTALKPIVGGIRTTSSFLSTSKDLSRVGYAFDVKVGSGRLLVTSLRFREHFDEAYPEAIYLFDRMLRYAAGGEFAPAVEVGAEQLQVLTPR